MQVPRLRRVVPRALALMLGLMVVVAASACAAAPPAQPGGDGSLVGRSFVSESVTEDGRPRPLVPGTQVQLSFSDDGRTIGASAGCNSMGGPVQIRPHRLVIDIQWTTDMACDPPREAQDTWVIDFLSADPRYALRGDRLHLQVGGTVIEMVDAEVTPDQPLEGPTWQLESIVDDDVVSSLPAGTGATLTFGDGGVGVQIVDCNVGSGDVTIRGSEIDVGPLMMSLRACEQGPAQVEAAVVTVLQGTISYSIDGDVLTLTHPSGRGLVLRGTTPAPG